MSESLSVNGVQLDSRCYSLSDISGIMGSPARRGENIVIPGRDGELVRPNKRYDASDLVLKLSVSGSLADGSIPSGSDPEREFFKRRDELTSLFNASTVVLVHTLPDGSQRQAVCEVRDVIPWERVKAAPSADASVALRVVGAFWSDVTPVSQTFTVASGTSVNLTNFAGATAPMSDLVLTFGAGNNPTLSQGNRFFKYGAVISSGRQLQVNCADWSLGIGTGTAWSPNRAVIEYNPGPNYFTLDPSVSLSVSLVHTGGGSMSCTISGYRKYLTS
ncbi:MAG: hypothetical protein EKK42_20370 [Pseudonocardiaceae bacterium]|nr:MAG: hypothetical protein EKK42_20370 [Pseudonocardiaceae bacterium]